MALSLWTEAAIILALILLNGYLAASEISLVSARRSRLRQLVEEEGDERAQAAMDLQEDPDRFLATIQVGITVIGALAGAIGGAAAVEELKPLLQAAPWAPVRQASGAIAIGVVVALISYLSIVLGELVPKSLAVANPEGVSRRVARVVGRLDRVARPFVWLLTQSTRAVLRPFGVEARGDATHVSEEEIKILVREGAQAGVLEKVEEELVHGVFEFTDIDARAVMVPRTRVVALPRDAGRGEVLKTIEEHRYTRYPVYGENLNDVVGLLYYKDLFPMLLDGAELDLEAIIRPVLFVPETAQLSGLMKEMQRKHTQLAVVVDEHGNVEGIVTMEDLLEEIVGEIEDESDVVEPRVRRLHDGALLVDGDVPIRELPEDVAAAVPEDPAYETLAGFILTALQRIPRGGEVVQSEGAKLTVVDMEGRRIARVKVELADGRPGSH